MTIRKSYYSSLPANGVTFPIARSYALMLGNFHD